MAGSNSSFLDKVLGRIGRLDTQGLQTVVERLARERSFLETLFNAIEDGVLVVDEASLSGSGNPLEETRQPGNAMTVGITNTPSQPKSRHKLASKNPRRRLSRATLRPKTIWAAVTIMAKACRRMRNVWVKV